MARRRKGFTLIELLVVIAIIGILAAMVFPVFARARESARKAVCLSNVKNIGLAIQMYLADNGDAFWPMEHRQEVHDYFNTRPGGRDEQIGDPDEDCHIGTLHANPYLRVPVVLDEYVKNRDVWRCPSAKMSGGAVFINGNPDWFGYLVSHEGEWGTDTDPYICVKDGSYPQGWGGVVTDSILQRQMASVSATGDRQTQQKAFSQSYASNDVFYYTKFVEIQDATNYVAVADSGSCTDFLNAALIAWPDICNANCANCACSDWRETGGCYDSQMADCPECASVHARGGDDPKTNFLMNPDLRKAYTRHLGGSNIGWADGHASWMLADAWLDKWAEDAKASNSTLGLGVWSWGPVSWCSDSDETGGDPFSVAFPNEPTLR